MFETAVVRTHVADRRISWLTFSLAAHGVVITAVLAAGIATVRLPEQAPRMMVAFIPTSAPPPALGTPNPTPAPPRPRAASVPRMPVAPPAVTAPQVIPDTIVPAAASSPAPSADPSDSNVIGTDTGSPIGVGAATPSTAAPDATGPLRIGNGVKAPVVIRRVEPVYPPFLVRAHMNGTVVLECIIDKAGHIRETHVESSSFGAFEQPAIDAVRQWLFAPGTLNGEPVDTIFQLTVRFQVR